MTYVTGRSNALLPAFTSEDDLSDLSYRDEASQRAIKRPRSGEKSARAVMNESSCEENSDCSVVEETELDEGDRETRNIICANIRLLTTTHRTPQLRLVDWCETGQATISKLLGNIQYSSETVKKIAAYYHVSLLDLSSANFEQAALKSSYPMATSALSSEREKLKRMAHRITLLCYSRVITEKQLADWCPCHETLIHNIKKGINQNYTLIERVASYFKMSVKDLADPSFELPGRLSQIPRDLASSKLKEHFRKQIGANVTMLIKYHKVKRKQLAEWCDCYPSTINKIKTGSDSASLIIAKIAHFFNLPVSDLYLRDIEPELLQKALPGLTGSKEEVTERWKHFGENLRALRERLSIDLEEMAHAVKYGYSVIRAFEEDFLQDEEKARQIVGAFHIELGDFLRPDYVKNLGQHKIEAYKKQLSELF